MTIAAIVAAMRVLAIDTALEACAAAVLDTEHGTAGERIAADGARPRRSADAADRPRHAPGRLPFSALDRIAVTTGPGSFTGLRVGISAARGIALAAGKPAIGLTTLAAYAAPYIAARRQDRGRRRDRCAPPARLSAGFRAGRAHAGRAAHRQRAPTRCARRPTARSGSSAPAPTCSRRRGRRASRRRRWWRTGARRTSSGSARLAVAADESAGAPKPLYLRAPDAQPQDAARLPRR